MTGKVKRWIDERGFGFITNPKPGEPDLFVHVTKVLDPSRKLYEGDEVEFEIELTPKGPAAVNVRRVDYVGHH